MIKVSRQTTVPYKKLYLDIAYEGSEMQNALHDDALYRAFHCELAKIKLELIRLLRYGEKKPFINIIYT